MARKKTIKVPDQYANAVIGIVADLPTYQLAHLLNKHTYTILQYEENLPIFIEKQQISISVDFYHGYNENYQTFFSLIQNTANKHVVIPALAKVNFFLVIKGLLSETMIKELPLLIKKIPHVIVTSLIDQNAHKQFPTVMEYIEMHLLDIEENKKKQLLKPMPSAEEQ